MIHNQFAFIQNKQDQEKIEKMFEEMERRHKHNLTLLEAKLQEENKKLKEENNKLTDRLHNFKEKNWKRMDDLVKALSPWKKNHQDHTRILEAIGELKEENEKLKEEKKKLKEEDDSSGDEGFDTVDEEE